MKRILRTLMNCAFLWIMELMHKYVINANTLGKIMPLMINLLQYKHCAMDNANGIDETKPF
ncbi:MAG: hypothetical protein IJV35_11065 [Neisseriaceae bacterium]|nr:hypothetical protein [Neisseriaceae bacterium]